jgi:short-subunit dehydrogenase
MITSALFHRCATVIAAAATTTTTTLIFFACCDCNPTLFLADRWFQWNNKQRTNTKHSQINSFCNQRIWIIGASSGIGEELAYQLVSPNSYASEDACLQKNPPQCHHPIHLILSSRSVDKLEKVASTCRLSNVNCTITVLGLDVTDDGALSSAVHFIHSSIGPVDTVVFNAGHGHLSPATETSVRTIDTVWKQTARWPMILIPLLFQYKIFENNRKNRPHVVVSSSIAAIVPVPLSASYAAAKSALLGYFRSLHCENPNILLHTIMPGPVDTNFFRQNKFISSIHDTSESKSTTTVSSNNTADHQKSLMKMSVRRCVQLIVCTMQLPYSTESWIAQQPLLLALYVQKLFPIELLQSLLYSRVGPKRIHLWREGLDLYNPKSWRK